MEINSWTYFDWVRYGKAHYGLEDTWRYKCPLCGNIQSINSVMAHNTHLDKKQIKNKIGTHCEGNFSAGFGCHYIAESVHADLTLYIDGTARYFFAFAEENESLPSEKDLTLMEIREQEGFSSNCIFLVGEIYYSTFDIINPATTPIPEEHIKPLFIALTRIEADQFIIDQKISAPKILPLKISEGLDLVLNAIFQDNPINQVLMKENGKKIV
jgi:hypothetical protein